MAADKKTYRDQLVWVAHWKVVLVDEQESSSVIGTIKKFSYLMLQRVLPARFVLNLMSYQEFYKNNIEKTINRKIVFALLLIGWKFIAPNQFKQFDNLVDELKNERESFLGDEFQRSLEDWTTIPKGITFWIRLSPGF